MLSNLKVILFDLGRVLMHIDFDAFPIMLGLFTKEQRAKYNESQIKRTVIKYETGKISTEEFLDSLYHIFLTDFPQKEILNAYDAIIVQDNLEIISFVKECKEKYTIAILSNTSPSHWDKILRISSVVKLFPHTFTSFQLRAMKPEKIVYEKVCASLNVKPHDVLFIDDLKENVDGAIKVGMNGIVFHDSLQLGELILRSNEHLK